jgi:hypothetical protein
VFHVELSGMELAAVLVSPPHIESVETGLWVNRRLEVRSYR